MPLAENTTPMAAEKKEYSFADIYAILEQEIIDLTAKPGSLLSENPLCKRFGVSRTLVRGVLQRLQEKELVQIVPYKGTWVTLLNFDIVNQLIFERVAVESRVIREFIASATDGDFALIAKRLLRHEEILAQQPVDLNRLYAQDSLLHETWFAATGKLYLWEKLQNAHADYSRFRMLDTVEDPNFEEVIADHRLLIRLITEKRADEIEPLIERHLYGSMRRLDGKIKTEFIHYFKS